MADTSQETSPFRHKLNTIRALTLLALAIGVALRILATRGELWLDEVWSLLHVSDLSTPIEVFTKVRHDNNHLLNSVWMWMVRDAQNPLVYRLPSLLFSALTLLLILRETRSSSERITNIVWLILIASSYPLILYGSEARGYALVILMSVVGFLSLRNIFRDPHDLKHIVVFSGASIVGCLAHAIYVLFLTPAIVWIGIMLFTARLRGNTRKVIRIGIVPPVLVACFLTLTFYRQMEIGGAPLLPYLEVGASMVSVSFGGESLSPSNPSVTGWSLFLCIAVLTMCAIEMVLWVRSKDPMALLVCGILITPSIAVVVFQPHFILGRYFIIQVLFAYLVCARFLTRLAAQGRLGSCICVVLITAFVLSNLRHTYQVITLGRSRFNQIFTSIADGASAEPVTIGGEQDFQNSLRLRYFTRLSRSELPFSYVPVYRGARTPPSYIIRETHDAYEQLPTQWVSPQGAPYRLIASYRAPPLNGSNVFVYQQERP